MQFKSPAGMSQAFLGLVAAFTVSACASSGARVATAADTEIYNLEKLAAAWVAKGIPSVVEGDKVVTRLEDMGVVVLSLPLPDSELVRMFTIWLKDPEVELTVEWLFKLNLQNRDRIVKVYLDEDDDVVTEWYVDVHPGLRSEDVVEAGRVFAVRSLAVARDISDFLK